MFREILEIMSHEFSSYVSRFAKLYIRNLKVLFSKNKISNMTSKLFVFYIMIPTFFIVNLNYIFFINN